MLYAGCSCCGAIVPLWCSGQFMPHMPTPAVRIPNGVGCPVCGPLPPIFTCGFCWTRQMLFLPGATPMAQPAVAGAPAANVAPVVEAQAGASKSDVSSLFGQFANGFAKQLGQEAASAIGKRWG